MLHHNGEVRPLVTFAVRRHLLTGIFEAITVKAMMDGRAVKIFYPLKLWHFVDEPRCEKDLGGRAGAAVRAVEGEALLFRPDISDSCHLERNRFITGEVASRLFHEIHRRRSFASEKAMNGLRSAVALLIVIADENLPAASSQD